MKQVKPSMLKKWEDIDKSKAILECVGNNPEWYGWYKIDNKFLPHRKATISEMLNNKFK
jgi:hypothetical protein